MEEFSLSFSFVHKKSMFMFFHNTLKSHVLKFIDFISLSIEKLYEE
jgi:hypothetical protein